LHAGQAVLRCAIAREAGATSLVSYDADTQRCVVGSGGCDLKYEEFSGKIAHAIFGNERMSSVAKASAKTGGAEASGCYRVSLARQPRWVSSATWVEDLKELVVVDPRDDNVLAYKPSGEMASMPGSLVKIRKEIHPAVIAPDGSSGFLVEGINGELQRLDNGLRPQNPEYPLKYRSPDGIRVGSLYQWKAAGDSIVAYGTLIGRDSRPATGFFYVPLHGSKTPLGMIKSLEDSSYYLLGNSYIATEKEIYYFLAMDKNPSLYRVSPVHGGRAEKLDIKQLDVLPEEYRTRPDFKTHMTGRNSAAPHFAELETFTVISGLYAQDGLLYLLARKPSGTDRTSWLLFQIDPKTPKVIGQVTLPTSADFLTVIPSPKKWFLLERGPVSDGQRQEIKSLLVIDKSSVVSLTSMPSDCPTR
jgi:hypothetical protein